nr:MAG TPA: hypothetical protein [Caudoviricetes sp.]
MYLTNRTTKLVVKLANQLKFTNSFRRICYIPNMLTKYE